MKIITALLSLSILLTGHALAATDHEICVQEMNTLAKREQDRCSGLSYLLNPSGCFAAQKALKVHQSGRCREIVKTGEVRPEMQPPSPPPTDAPPVRSPPALPAPDPKPPAEPPHAETPPATSPAPSAASGEGSGAVKECGQLRAENARLTAETDRLRAELELLRKP